MAKLKAYELQDQGLDTVEANEELGFAADCRAYELPGAVLKLLGISQVRLITNNPDKVAALESAGIAVVERVSAEVAPQETFERYRQDQARKDGPHSGFGGEQRPSTNSTRADCKAPCPILAAFFLPRGWEEHSRKHAHLLTRYRAKRS